MAFALTQNTITTAKANINILDRQGHRTRDLWHRSLMRYLSATEATERIDCTPAIKLLQRYASKHTQNKNKFLSHTFFSINLKCIDKYIWQFLIFTGIGLTA